ncbi:1233_t:CDS:2 [Funneliformis mosseae]|uniref:1233_t:CDS:1 n=1 Tax=Funneliformis mosseae TaxID=27381 RepID=A0A9N9C500_FUNMO|nr:1233_t:CDS:2 [Funneliformis mosseae]
MINSLIPNNFKLLEKDSDLNAHEFIHIEDEILKGRLTDNEILDYILNSDKDDDHIELDEIEFTVYLKLV